MYVENCESNRKSTSNWSIDGRDIANKNLGMCLRLHVYNGNFEIMATRRKLEFAPHSKNNAEILQQLFGNSESEMMIRMKMVSSLEK